MNRRSFALALLLVPLMRAPAGAQDAPPVEPVPVPASEPARVEGLERLHDEAFRDERRIMQGLVGGADALATAPQGREREGEHETMGHQPTLSPPATSRARWADSRSADAM